MQKCTLFYAVPYIRVYFLGPPETIAKLDDNSMGLWMIAFMGFINQQSLVGGIPTPLKNMSSSIGMMTFPTEWKKTCSKAPTRS